MVTLLVVIGSIWAAISVIICVSLCMASSKAHQQEEMGWESKAQREVTRPRQSVMGKTAFPVSAIHKPAS